MAWRRGNARSTATFAAPDPVEMNRRFKLGFALHGNTFPHRQEIRKLGGEWDRTRQQWLMPDDASRARAQDIVYGIAPTTKVTVTPQAAPVPPTSTPKSDTTNRLTRELRTRVSPMNSVILLMRDVFPAPSQPLLDWAASARIAAIQNTAAPGTVNGFAITALNAAQPAFVRGNRKNDPLKIKKRKDSYDKPWEERLRKLREDKGDSALSFDVEC